VRRGELSEVSGTVVVVMVDDCITVRANGRRRLDVVEASLGHDVLNIRVQSNHPDYELLVGLLRVRQQYATLIASLTPLPDIGSISSLS
jgi:hypothetical protein